MTQHSRRRKIEELVDEVIADPSRADSVKDALKHIAESSPSYERGTSKRPARFEVEDFFDNVPV